jgi:hypothetical protein
VRIRPQELDDGSFEQDLFREVVGRTAVVASDVEDSTTAPTMKTIGRNTRPPKHRHCGEGEMRSP